MDAQAVAVGVDDEIWRPRWVLSGERDGKEAEEDDEDRRDTRADEHEVVGHGEEPLVPTAASATAPRDR
jgi:hypothetical protein